MVRLLRSRTKPSGGEPGPYARGKHANGRAGAGVPEPNRLGWRAFVRKADKQRAGLVGAILRAGRKRGGLAPLPLFTGAYPGVLQTEIAACSLHRGGADASAGRDAPAARVESAADRPHPSHQWLLAAECITDMVINVKPIVPRPSLPPRPRPGRDRPPAPAPAAAARHRRYCRRRRDSCARSGHGRSA